ncbi:hypothetical protein F511_21606 [Dorcoceras hygrometricum]|uniref:Uncharacterized protein n=1 Tax=Dorcoceras hygrometricum TaxID=472368 RepID=A0A2Z7AU55_9LAMI|nr:hypothetical protein F511_21606 [Dorcoceras hygrometricum]
MQDDSFFDATARSWKNQLQGTYSLVFFKINSRKARVVAQGEDSAGTSYRCNAWFKATGISLATDTVHCDWLLTFSLRLVDMLTTSFHLKRTLQLVSFSKILASGFTYVSVFLRLVV